jgi:hypothetical protein
MSVRVVGKNKFALIVAALLLSAAIPALAANNYTNVSYEIRDVVLFSKQDPVYPEWAGFVEVEFVQPLAWAVSGVCAGSGVAIRGTDTHLIASAQTAYAMSRPIRVYVDDSQRLSGGYCILRAFSY